MYRGPQIMSEIRFWGATKLNFRLKLELTFCASLPIYEIKKSEESDLNLGANTPPQKKTTQMKENKSNTIQCIAYDVNKGVLKVLILKCFNVSHIYIYFILLKFLFFCLKTTLHIYHN